MMDTAIWVIVNLDLDEDLFVAIIDRIGVLSGFSGHVTTLDRLDDTIETSGQGQINLVLVFTRQLDQRSKAVTRGLSKIAQLEQTLETRQLKRFIKCITFIDCSEMPNAPLSDIWFIKQYREAVIDTFPLARFGGLYTLDAEGGPPDDWSAGKFTWWNTRSTAFEDHVRDYLIELLRFFDPSDDPDGPDDLK